MPAHLFWLVVPFQMGRLLLQPDKFPGLELQLIGSPKRHTQAADPFRRQVQDAKVLRLCLTHVHIKADNPEADEIAEEAWPPGTQVKVRQPRFSAAAGQARLLRTSHRPVQALCARNPLQSET